LQQGVRANQEVGHGAVAAVGTLAVAALHLTGAQCGAGFGGQVGNAGVFNVLQHLAAVFQGGADFGQHHVADHHRAGAQGVAQGFGDGFGRGAVAKEVDQR